MAARAPSIEYASKTFEQLSKVGTDDKSGYRSGY
jgi:hypothetical protein